MTPPPASMPPAPAATASASSSADAPAPQLFAAGPQKPERFADPARLAKIDAAIPEIEAMLAPELASQKLPGLSFAIVVDGQIRFFRGLGVADVTDKRAVTVDTVYRVGSITKTFTAAALLKLRDEGKLSLDDPAERYVPELARVRYPTHDAPKITLRMLMSHTSGLPRDGTYDSDQALRDVTEKEVRDSLTDLGLVFVPGTAYRYSNLGFSLLGLVVAKVAGRPYREAMQELVLAPLGLGSAAWDPATIAKDRLATGYKRDGDTHAPLPPWKLGASEADGGLFVSMQDLARWATFQLDAYPPRDDAETGPLRRASVREAHTLGRLLGLDVSRPTTAEKGDPLVDARARAVGLAWHGSARCDVDHVIGHDGAVDGYHAAMELLPRHGVAVIALTNQRSSPMGGLVRRALRALLKKGIGPREPVVEASPALAASITPWLSVYDAAGGWDEARYAAMLSDGHKRNVAAEAEKKEIEGYRRLHGRCAEAKLTKVDAPGRGTFTLACERGRLELGMTVEPGTGKIAGFAGESFGVALPKPALDAAARVQAQIARFDAKAFERDFAPSFVPKETQGFFAGLARIHGACKAPVPRSIDFRGNAFFDVPCERGGDLTLRVHLEGRKDAPSGAEAKGAKGAPNGANGKDAPQRIDGFSLVPKTPSTCPVE